MSSTSESFLVTLEFFSSLELAVENEHRQNKCCYISVPIVMKRVFEYDNITDEKVEIDIRTTKGLWNRDTDLKRDTIINSFDESSKFDFAYNLVNIEASGKHCFNGYGYEEDFYHEVLTEGELYDGEKISTKVIVQPKTKLTRWQLVATMANVIIGFGKIIDTDEDLTKQMAEASLRGKAKIIIPRKIAYGTTNVRIRHKATGKYLTPVLAKGGWDVITLKQCSDCYFVLREDIKGVRIEAVKCTHPKYRYVYSTDHGNIYLNQLSKNDLSQIWIVSKSSNLRDGDVVTFRSRKWEASDLCHKRLKDRPTIDVFCFYNSEDEWVLQM